MVLVGYNSNINQQFCNFQTDQKSDNPEITSIDVSAGYWRAISSTFRFYYEDNDFWAW